MTAFDDQYYVAIIPFRDDQLYLTPDKKRLIGVIPMQIWIREGLRCFSKTDLRNRMPVRQSLSATKKLL